MDEKLNEYIEGLGMIPIKSTITTILLDLQLLPLEYKCIGNLEDTLKAYEDRFNVKVIPIDTSRKNLGEQVVAQIVK